VQSKNWTQTQYIKGKDGKGRKGNGRGNGVQGTQKERLG